MFHVKQFYKKKGVDKMLFTKGNYKHETGFEIMVTETGDILISPDHPLSLRLSEIFDKNKWTKVE